MRWRLGFQALSYERLRGMFRDAFGLDVSDGAVMNMFIRSHAEFEVEASKARAILRATKVVASDEIGVRIEGTNSHHWVFHCKESVVHQSDYSRLFPRISRLRPSREKSESWKNSSKPFWPRRPDATSPESCKPKSGARATSFSPFARPSTASATRDGRSRRTARRRRHRSASSRSAPTAAPTGGGGR